MTGIRLRAKESSTVTYEASVANAMLVSTSDYGYEVQANLVSSYPFIGLPYGLYDWLITYLNQGLPSLVYIDYQTY